MQIKPFHRRLTAFFLIFSFLVTTRISDINVYADKTILSERIYYHLDMGVQLAYNEGCDWGSRVYGKDSILASPTISMGTDVEVVEVYPYEDSGYNIDTGSENLHGSGSGQEKYNEYYREFVTNSMVVKNYSSRESEITFSYIAELKSMTPLNVVDMGANKLDSKVYSLFGGRNDLEDMYPEIAAAIETALTAGRNGTAGTNRLYLVFCPTVIEYKKYVTIGELEAGLDLPQSAKQDEEYAVSDASIVDDNITLDYAILEKCYDSGAWQTVVTWEGSGKPGENTGESIKESCPDLCTITYRLTIYDTYGQSDTATAAIDITDKRDISVIADLVMPDYTFEGHTFPAKDQSVFEVDGVNYSAARAYAENIARNSFKANSSYGRVSRINNTMADVSFSKRGTYTVTLTVNPINGGRATDTETIEVRKTPYIIDTISGFQKQNRKQILNIAVATFPGKPITDFNITLRDKKTGDSIILTSDNPQENNATIKTRTIQRTDSEDGCFTYFTVEFLTKTPAYDAAHPDNTQNFYYEINVEDSKGDTDTKSKTFIVSPDLPPTAAISLDSAFLRNEGTNVASIKAEDVTIAADGDEVARTWFYGATTAPSVYTDVSTMAGYQKLSFGTDKIVGFDKVGVGKFTTKLYVKEVWTEPTLPEYVSSSDYLTGTAIAYSDVQNVAPVVSLELLEGLAQKVLLLANSSSEYQTLLNHKTAMQQILLSNQIDAQLIIKKLLGNSPAGVSGITNELSYTYSGPVWKNGVEEESDYTYLTADSEKSYIATWTWTNNVRTTPITIHAYDPFSGQVWTYTTTRNETFQFGNDDTEKYLYLIYSDANQTVILDKETGTFAGTVNIALSDKVWLSDDLIFTIKDGDLYAVNRASLAAYSIDSDVFAVCRVAGDIQYITKSDSGLIRNIVDTETLSTTKQLIVETDNGLSSADDYTPVCIDSAGTAVFYKTAGTGSDRFNGLRIYNARNSLKKEIAGAGGTTGIFAPVDEKGICNHVLMWGWSSGGSNGFVAFNLNTGTTATWHKTAPYSFLRSIGGCTSYFETEGKSYYYFPGWYMSAGSGYFGNSYLLTFTGSSLNGGVTGSGDPGCIGTTDEKYTASDRIVSSLFGNSSTGVIYFKISSFPKTLAQETAEAVAKFAGKHAFVGDVDTTAAQIQEAANAAEKAIKITANKNGYLYLNNLSLVPGKKYYYDYEIQPLISETKSGLNGITASTGSTTSTQSFNGNTLYVTDSYYEDFNNSIFDENLTVTDTGSRYAGKFGAEGAWDSDLGYNTSAQLSFTVPSGKQATVSFDYYYHVWATDYSISNIFIDGVKVDENPNATANDGKYYTASGSKLFYKLLDSGTHTVSIVASSSHSENSVYIDNLKVDILSTTTSASIDKYTASEEDGWVDFSGYYKIPNKIMSYGAQSSAYSTAALPSAVTATYYYKGRSYIKTTEYYETVPAGYLQKGHVHLASTYMYTKADAEYIVAGGAEYEYPDDDVTVDVWAFTGVKSVGSYTHVAHIDAASGPRYYQVYIDGFQFVTYPDNAVTRTGNMAFNSTNTEYFFPKVSSTGVTNLRMYLPKGEYLIKNLKIYYIEDGKKIFLQNKSLEDITELSNWSLSSGLTASNATTEKEEPADDEYIKIYKKGQKVLYNIFYSDYEEDPSKMGYWIYTHINWPPDPVHPDAGKVLNAPIDRFYLSGKYTVTHWEVDNTQRPGTFGDASPYDKESNKVELTFYVNGEGNAPWVTYIKTNPLKVKENSAYALAVGVDDAEKDSLQLVTEVYQNGKRILTDTKTGIIANGAGNYPEQTITGLPTAKAGVYQVICTVRDYSGTGIKAYKFTVVSEGRVTGAVNHTEQWDENRKKYNLKRFSEEVNRALLLGDYIAMAAPRMRGTNVFWSGEKFMLRAETEGEPTSVSVQLMSVGTGGVLTSTGYSTTLVNTGSKTAAGAEIWEGSLWNAAMINKWGRKEPEELTFRFTASYPGNLAKTHTVSVIIDSDRDYWQLHRLW